MNHYLVQRKDNQSSLPIAVFSDIPRYLVDGVAPVDDGLLEVCFFDKEYQRDCIEDYRRLFDSDNTPCPSLLIRDTGHTFHAIDPVSDSRAYEEIDRKKTNFGSHLIHSVECEIFSSDLIDEMILVIKVKDEINSRFYTEVRFDENEETLAELFRKHIETERALFAI